MSVKINPEDIIKPIKTRGYTLEYLYLMNIGKIKRIPIEPQTKSDGFPELGKLKNFGKKSIEAITGKIYFK